MLFEVAGACLFGDELTLKTIQAFCNSSVAEAALSLMSPTLNFEVGQIGSLPILFTRVSPAKIAERVDFLRNLSTSDRDSAETSLDFKRSPLL